MEKPGSATWDTTWQSGIASWNHASARRSLYVYGGPSSPSLNSSSSTSSLTSSSQVLLLILFLQSTFHAFPALSALLDHQHNQNLQHTPKRKDFYSIRRQTGAQDSPSLVSELDFGFQNPVLIFGLGFILFFWICDDEFEPLRLRLTEIRLIFG